MAQNGSVTGIERFFDDDSIIVSKTDLKGRLTYCNKQFLDVAGYTEKECLGQPHSMIRHPHMPRCVFALLWDAIQNGHEIFANVINRAKNGDHYWVLAHVTPSYDTNGTAVGYHSTRRVPDPQTVKDVIVPLYRDLLQIEASHADRKQGMAASFQTLVDILTEKNIRYDEFVASLAPVGEDDVPVLYAFGSAWAGWIQARGDDWGAIAELILRESHGEPERFAIGLDAIARIRFTISGKGRTAPYQPFSNSLSSRSSAKAALRSGVTTSTSSAVRSNTPTLSLVTMKSAA